jgi:Arc/MetJ-type ribon-helix-helix transcriptional regulator
MIGGMTTKIAVSLPDDQVAAARAAVEEGRARSVSAYVSTALARQSAEDELLVLLDHDEIAGEPATDQHRTWAREALDARGSTEERGQRERVSDAPARGRSTKGATTGRPVRKDAVSRPASTSVESARSTSRRG